MAPLSLEDALAAHQRVLAALAAFTTAEGPELVLQLFRSDALKPNDGDVGREAQRLLGEIVGEIWSRDAG